MVWFGILMLEITSHAACVIFNKIQQCLLCDENNSVWNKCNLHVWINVIFSWICDFFKAAQWTEFREHHKKVNLLISDFQRRRTPNVFHHCMSDVSGLRSLLITSDSILLHRAAYGLRTTACCRANSLPSAAAFSKSALASSFWHASLCKRPRCTSAWQAVRPVLPLRAIAWSRSPRAPARREEHREPNTCLKSWFFFRPWCSKILSFGFGSGYWKIHSDKHSWNVLELLFSQVLWKSNNEEKPKKVILK